jgi:hypothetical protein
MKDYSQAIYIAQQRGVDLRGDFHAQNIGEFMAELAREHGYRKPKNANGSTGRYFFQLLQRELRKS